MINNVVNFPQFPDVTQVQPTPDVPREVAGASSANGTKNESQNSDLSSRGEKGPPPEYSLRLTVDKDPDSGDWVYKAIDRYTGEVVRQLPREELLKLRKSANYQAGSVIKTDV
jgi:flagellar protein FlaG